jgi:hypothetical protein
MARIGTRGRKRAKFCMDPGRLTLTVIPGPAVAGGGNWSGDSVAFHRRVDPCPASFPAPCRGPALTRKLLRSPARPIPSTPHIIIASNSAFMHHSEVWTLVLEWWDWTRAWSRPCIELPKLCLESSLLFPFLPLANPWGPRSNPCHTLDWAREIVRVGHYGHHILYQAASGSSCWLLS